jgi:hypothetical protein
VGAPFAGADCPTRKKVDMGVKETEFPWESGLGRQVPCACGYSFILYYNGGELDAQTCKCGREYYGYHKETVLVMREYDNSGTE